jgi:transcriptional regulator with XRE-family HTH domain
MLITGSRDANGQCSEVGIVSIALENRKPRGRIRNQTHGLFFDVVSQGHLSKIERERIAPSIEILLLLADKFRKSVDWILREDGK